MRRLVLALLMLNLLYVLWAVLRPAPAPTSIAAERQFPESLVLLQEIGHPLAVIEGPPDSCTALGPFAAETDLYDFAETHLQDQAWRIHTEQQALSPMYRVYVPAADATPEGGALLASVRSAIAAADLDIDSYLIVGGELDSAVSLGLFADQGNARGIHEQIASLGIAVEIQSESRARSLYSIVVADDGDSDFIQEIALALQAIDAQAGATEKLCEMIALPD